ncbi:MAG: sulfotransferase domain-containing protein [Cyanobacteria bacterium J06649_4]
MLIVSNGAFKSGSTWLYNILAEMIEASSPPQQYLHSGWVNPSIHRDQLANFLSEVDFSSHIYLTKNHYSKQKQREQLLAHDNIYILDIERDIKDVLVSAYYHFLRLEDMAIDFDTYYWSEGRLVVNRIKNYHQLWAQPSPQIYVSSYLRLKQNFEAEVREISNFLGLALSSEAIQRVQTNTSLDSLRKKYGERGGKGVKAPPCKVSSDKIDFFRKGVVGQWQDYLTPKILADVERVEQEGLTIFEKAVCKAKLRLFIRPKYC